MKILPVLLLIAATLVGLAMLPCSATGTASFYADSYEGRLMANGKPFRQSALTCATYRWPLGTKLRVRHGKSSVIVTVTDRGPDKRLGRLIDLSKAAFIKLGPLDAGLLNVEVVEIAKS